MGRNVFSFDENTPVLVKKSVSGFLYKAYKACDWMFGWRDDKYLPTGDQIVWMAEHNDVSCETLWSMFEKLEGENQNGKQMS